MEKVALITDSTVYLPDSYLKKHKIHVVSLNVIDGEKSYKELEIDNDFVFKRQDEKAGLTTSQPSPSEFVDAYNAAFKKGAEKVLVLTLSKGLSGTYQSAILGRNMVEEKEAIHVFDTNNAAYGNELLLEKLVDLLAEEKSLDNVIKRMNQVIENTHLYFTVENLYSLQKGGRLSKTQAFLGTVLRVKPIIGIDDGKLKLTHKERTHKKVYDFLLNKVKEDPNYSDDKRLNVRIITRNSEENATALKEMVEAEFKNPKVAVTDYLGPVFSIHVGKKGFGLAWFFE